MAKFLTGNELNSEVEKILERAEDHIILISPYIKLHDRYASTLKSKIKNDFIKIIVVFGKNEEDLSRSMKEEDFVFFKEFPNIEIRYEKRLHAKYYANENLAILTSMNLYSFSQDNNIEAGVMTKSTFLGSITNSENLDRDAYEYFERVIEQSELLFKKTPQYENTMLGLSKKYTGSIIEEDKLSDFFKNKPFYNSSKSKTFTNEKKSKSSESNKLGFCIRTGERIPFNPSQPYSNKAYQSWARYENNAYPEKYCHFSGEQSNGETTKEKPILKKNWGEAKKFF